MLLKAWLLTSVPGMMCLILRHLRNKCCRACQATQTPHMWKFSLYHLMHCWN